MKGWIVHHGFKPDAPVSILDGRYLPASQELDGLELEFRRIGHIGVSPELLAKQELPDFAILHMKHTAFGRLLEDMGVIVIDTPESIEIADSKIRTASLLWREGIPHPKTILDPYGRKDMEPESVHELISMLDSELGFPIICKQDQGLGGKQVHKFDTPEELLSSETFEALPPRLVFQEFLEETQAQDLRIEIIGGKFNSAVMRIGEEGNFRSNLSSGGHAIEASPTDEEIELALRAAAAAKLELAGIDILRTSNGPVVCELNSSPGFDMNEDVTGHPTALPILKYAMDVVSGKRERAYGLPMPTKRVKNS